MDKIKTVKIKNEDGSISEESYTISVDAKNVDMDNGKDLQDTIGNINIDEDGSVAEQLKKYKNYDADIAILYNNVNNLKDVDDEIEDDIIDLQVNKVNKEDIVNNLESFSDNKVLSANQGRILGQDINKKVYYFNTIADMKNADLKENDYVSTLGYHTVNDNGAGNYVIVSGDYTSDNGSYHQLNNNLFAKLIIKDVVNVKQFGAYGDKTHDDYEAFVNSIAYCDAINNYTLYVPTGDYKINTNLVITFPLSIRGEYCQYYNTNYTVGISKGSRLLCGYTGNEPFIKYSRNNGQNRLFGVKIEDLQIDGDSHDCMGLYLQRTGWEGHLTRVKIHNFNNTGLYLDRVYDTTFVECEIIRCGDVVLRENPNYALVLTDTADDTTNACHFFGLHVEHCRYCTHIAKGRNNTFVACKWEVGTQTPVDTENPSILFDKTCLETTFDGCMFVPAGVQDFVNAGVALSDIPPMIKTNWITNRLSYISFNGCHFSSPGQYGAYFIENDGGKMGITNCAFNTLSPKIYSLKLTRTMVNNCYFNILNIYDEPDIQSCPIYLEACQVENCYFDFSSTRGTVTKNKAMYLNSNNKVRNNIGFGVSLYDGNSSSNVIDRNPYRLLTNTDYLNAMGLTSETVDWNDLEIDLRKLNYSNFLLSFSQAVKITSITGGQNGETLNLINHGNYSITLAGMWEPSSGKRIKNAGTSYTSSTVLNVYDNATLVKTQYYWKTTSVN